MGINEHIEFNNINKESKMFESSLKIQIICNQPRCDEYYTNPHTGFSIFNNETQASDAFDNYPEDWSTDIDERHFCPKHTIMNG